MLTDNANSFANLLGVIRRETYPFLSWKVRVLLAFLLGKTLEEHTAHQLVDDRAAGDNPGQRLSFRISLALRKNPNGIAQPALYPPYFAFVAVAEVVSEDDFFDPCFCDAFNFFRARRKELFVGLPVEAVGVSGGGLAVDLVD